tara:strand:+ start:189 stop:578 length:390 start_codon:yes stop_codon:yes gene_type:complete
MENNAENTPNLDDKMNMLNDTRQELKKLQAQEKTLKDTQNYLEAEIAADMAKQGLTQTGNDVCTISIKTEVVPTVENWDALWEHIFDTRQSELLQKRMSATAYRELLAMAQTVPGVRSTELTRVNFRSK